MENNKNRQINKKTEILINFNIINNHTIQIFYKIDKNNGPKNTRYIKITKKEAFKYP